MKVHLKAYEVKQLANAAWAIWNQKFEEDKERLIQEIMTKPWPKWFSNRTYTREEAEQAFNTSYWASGPYGRYGEDSGRWLDSYGHLEIAAKLKNLQLPDTATVVLEDKEWNTLKAGM